ncbi:MAG: hypothetical protein E7331_12125 [Clostridiales bacterium]|nr:hypothetical protein [Clostridiales bacterium]
MLVSVNPAPSLKEFQSLMERTDAVLNADAVSRKTYYSSRNGSLLEDDVKSALDQCAKGTPFENTIEKVSGQRFPDIVAAKLYGVEVKSTKENHWTSTGSSILETTRISDVERIYMTFGKLGGNPVEFLSKPYEQCLYGIAVTHMPRYLINMQLPAGETIFDKMGISYDELRKMDNPIAPVSKYYRSRLKPGESLWWAGDSAEETVSATVRLWKNLSVEEKRRHTVFGCIEFPEIFSGDYDRYSLWLTSQGIVDPHIRDQFSAGGKEQMQLSSGEHFPFPGVFRRISGNLDLFLHIISQKGEALPLENCPVKGKKLSKRILLWCDSVSRKTFIDYEVSMDALCVLFFHASYQSIKDNI